MPEARITRDDIQAKAEQIRQRADQGARAAAPGGLAAAGALVVVVVGVAYLLGRRRGRRNKTVVEVRRV
ncbi:MAG: hypothetical protein ACYCTI_12615 [Acidimicrobiales bacterium]